jgi:membrane-associated phospholipid phosphatase
MSLIAKIFLEFSNIEILLPVILLGLISRPKIFLTPTFLVLITLILTPLLKAIFAIPYSPELVAKLGKNGFAFPSGHMQTSCVFYGWFLFNFSNKYLRAALSALILGIGFGLIYEGYHNIFDVLGGMFFALSTIYFAIYLKLNIRKNITIHRQN